MENESSNNNIIISNPKLLQAIAHTLEKQIQSNNNNKQQNEQQNELNEQKQQQQTLFEAQKQPAICLMKYMERIKKFAIIDDQVFIVALIYVERLVQASKHIQLTSLTVHRLLFLSTIMAIKFYSDLFYKNSYYAKVGGIQKDILNQLEIEFIENIDYKLRIEGSEFDACEQKLEEIAQSL